MLVWVQVGEGAVRAGKPGRVVGVVHARPEIGVVEDLVLMVEAEGVADFLAHHHLPPRGRVVLSGAEIRIVDLGSALHDVAAAVDPDLSEAEPVVLAIRCVADLDPPTCRTACSRVPCTGDDRRVQHARIAPVGRGGC
jgi:hypothetical protein